MHIVDIRSMDLMEGWFADDPSVHFRANFALHRGNGARDSAAVVIELAPGDVLGEHTDSPEEILLVLEGEVEFTVGEERRIAPADTLAVVPPMAPHAIRNVGPGTARVIGFFPRSQVVATFVEPIQPLGERILLFGEGAVAAD